MPDDKTVRGTNFTCFHAGPTEGWAQFHMDPPEVPRPARGKLFLRKFLGSAGLEVSLNVLPPGKGIPFLHRHRQHDEVYLVIGGRGRSSWAGGASPCGKARACALPRPRHGACGTAPSPRW